MTPTGLQAIGERAVEYVADGHVVGLGTGRAAAAFLEALAAQVRGGLRVRGVATSRASAELAQRLQIPLVSLDEAPEIDATIDGADEIDPHGNAIKGYGGALVREKIVAAASRRLVLLVGDEKLVPVLGSRGKLPVEVVPFGVAATARRLTNLGLVPALRMADGKPFVSDNGNQILDCGTGPIPQPAELEAEICAIPGVVGTGLFLGLVDVVLIARGGQVEVRETGLTLSRKQTASGDIVKTR
ncbi:MAG: ribose-5-phosphate isomerase RpiA [Pirellulaceae bacterium]